MNDRWTVSMYESDQQCELTRCKLNLNDLVINYELRYRTLVDMNKYIAMNSLVIIIIYIYISIIIINL